MADETFIPYWKPLGVGSGPNSWVFYAVAKVAGRYRPVAVVSSVGGFEESLHGPPAGLAATYYADHGDLVDGRRPAPAELPELTREDPGDPRRRRPWDRAGVQPFPFITASLLQGVALDPTCGRTAPSRPEPLRTVYRDADIEWGMVVLDITDPAAVRYGIVGFRIGMAKFVASVEGRRAPFQGANFQCEEGPPRVLEEVRPRKAMSAADYKAKFEYAALVRDASQYKYDMELLASVPLVDDAAFSLVWPSGEKGEEDDPNISVLDEVRNLAGFQPILQQCLLQNSWNIGNNLSAGRLIRLAFNENGYLRLEKLKDLSAQSISAALEYNLGMADTIKSLSLCIDNVQSTPAQLAEALSRSSGLGEICLLQNPTRESDTLSAQLFAELASRPQIVSRIRLTFTGAYSAALRKNFWLPTSISLTTLVIFPVQQMFVRFKRRMSWSFEFDYDTVHLSDRLLRPEHFAAGFPVWVSTLESRDSWMFEESAPFFSFSSGPISLSEDPLSAAETTPILCENLSLPDRMPDRTYCAPRARDLVPSGWTVLVSQEQDMETRFDGPPYIRYAFVRARGQPIVVEDPPSSPPGPEKLKVVGLKEFMSATAPEVDPAVVDMRLEDMRLEDAGKRVKAWAAANNCGTPWPAGLDPLSVLTQGGGGDFALGMLR
ncbi:hypothetical protein PG994_009636 [Apiospora phragmitis]|uniref:Uncharacterized protein n=1 Tax=Apiospora phragmitis TaxID=2905665 RepID=A0ABR1U6Q9_9PEZI